MLVQSRRADPTAAMTDRTLLPALLLFAAALAGCNACDDDRETRRIDLGLSPPPQTTPPDPPPDAPPAAPAGEEIAATPQGDGGEPAAETGETSGSDRPPESSAGAANNGTAASGVGAAPPQQP
jgi:hypothetical protein